MIFTFLRRHPTLTLIIVWLGLEIPFLPTAFRIDEPYYLAIDQLAGGSKTGFGNLRQSSSRTGLDRRLGMHLPSK
jgi:hypothetical protein